MVRITLSGSLVADQYDLRLFCCYDIISSIIPSFSYQDTVALFPMHSLTVEKLATHSLEVLQMLEEVGFNAVALCSDGMQTNVSYFKQLGGGQLQSCVRNLANPQKKNFQKKQLFFFPPMPECNVPPMPEKSQP